jgi:hypothetical protein
MKLLRVFVSSALLALTTPFITSRADLPNARFDCIADSNILYTTYENPRINGQKRKVFRWEKVRRKENEDGCVSFHRVINPHISSGKLGYIIPAFSIKNSQPLLCWSPVPKNKRTKDTFCDKSRTLTFLTMQSDPNKYLPMFARLVNSKDPNEPPIILNSTNALRKDIHGEPFIDIRRLVIYADK